jgi:DNA repair photolyase
MNVVNNKTILTSTGGFLADGYTHTINPYVGCAFAGALCGTFCYAQHNPWITKGRPWGLFGVKENLQDPYRREYDRLKHPRTGAPRPLRILLSSSTDPYIPQEQRLERTRTLLTEMVVRPPDVLMIQTHNILVRRDFELIVTLSTLCELWVSITVETDMDPVPGFPPHASRPARRLDTLKMFRTAGVRTQAAISPLLPLAHMDEFAQRLYEACDRVIVDHYLLGDGSPNGLRTKRTDVVQRLEQAGFSQWTTLEKFWEVRDFLTSVLWVDRVLVSKEGFNAVGRAGKGVRHGKETF